MWYNPPRQRNLSQCHAPALVDANTDIVQCRVQQPLLGLRTAHLLPLQRLTGALARPSGRFTHHPVDIGTTCKKAA